MAQSVKRLLHNREALGRHLKRRKQANPWSSLASRLNQIVSSRFGENPCLKNTLECALVGADDDQGDGFPGEVPPLYLGFACPRDLLRCRTTHFVVVRAQMPHALPWGCKECGGWLQLGADTALWASTILVSPGAFGRVGPC